VGPLLFVAFGVGAGLASTFEPLRPLFGVLMLAMFALAFCTVYGRRTAGANGAACAPGEACEVPRSHTRENDAPLDRGDPGARLLGLPRLVQAPGLNPRGNDE
jgi:hypothetical protein